MKKILKKPVSLIKILTWVITVGVVVTAGYFAFRYYQQTSSQINLLESNKIKLDQTLKQLSTDLKKLQSEDQYIINKDLEDKINSIETTYDMAVLGYEKLLDLRNQTKNTAKFDEQFANILTLLSERNYSSAEADLNKLSLDI